MNVKSSCICIYGKYNQRLSFSSLAVSLGRLLSIVVEMYYININIILLIMRCLAFPIISNLRLTIINQFFFSLQILESLKYLNEDCVPTIEFYSFNDLKNLRIHRTPMAISEFPLNKSPKLNFITKYRNHFDPPIFHFSTYFYWKWPKNG